VTRDEGIARAISEERGAADSRPQPTEFVTDEVIKAKKIGGKFYAERRRRNAKREKGGLKEKRVREELNRSSLSKYEE